MIDVESVDSVQESQRLWLLSGWFFKRESTAALVGEWAALRKRVDSSSKDEWTALRKRVDSGSEGEWTALQKRVDSGSEGEWMILQKRINSGSKVVGSSTERLDRNRLFDREA